MWTYRKEKKSVKKCTIILINGESILLLLLLFIIIIQILQSQIPEVSDVGENHQDVLDAIAKVPDVDHQETVYI